MPDDEPSIDDLTPEELAEIEGIEHHNMAEDVFVLAVHRMVKLFTHPAAPDTVLQYALASVAKCGWALREEMEMGT